MSNISRNDIGVFECSEQRLADQMRAIKVNKWLSDLEMEELRRTIDQCGAPSEHMTEVTPENHGDITDHYSSLQPEFEDPQPSENENLTAVSIGSKMHRDGLDDEYINLAHEILEEFEQGSNTKPYNLRRLDGRKGKQKVQEIDDVVSYITTRDICETNNLIRAAAFVVERSLGVEKGRTKGARKEPSWKQRLKKQIDELRKDIRPLNCMLRRGPIKRRVQGALEHKYKTKEGRKLS